jgi:hypothetical protein
MRLNKARELDLPGEDQLVDAEWILVVKGRVPGEHLVDEHSDGPPVNGFPVALALDDLGGEVLGRAAERPRAVLDTLSKAEVGDFDVADPVDQDVLRLQISVHNAALRILTNHRGVSIRARPGMESG